MTWSDIDWDDGVLVIPKTKARRARIIGLNREARRALRRYRNTLNAGTQMPTDEVWQSTTSGDALTANGLGQMIRKRSTQAGVDVTTHSFRRGFAVTWLSQGGSQTYLQTAAGWSSHRLVARYVAAVADREALADQRRLFG